MTIHWLGRTYYGVHPYMLASIAAIEKFSPAIHLIFRQYRLTNEYTMKPYDYDHLYAEQARILIETDIRHHYTIQELARRLNIGEKRLKIAFKHRFQKGIFEYLQDRRMEVAQGLLKTGATSKEIAHQLGYKNAGSFSRAYKKHTGHSPQSPTRNMR